MLKRENKIFCSGISTHINTSLNIGDAVCADISFEEESEFLEAENVIDYAKNAYFCKAVCINSLYLHFF